MRIKIAATALFLLLLSFGAEAMLCSGRSRTFKGWCTHNMNCAAVCMTEDYDSGHCEGIVIRKCMCTKNCKGKPPGGEKGKPAPGGEKGKPAPGGGGVKPPPGGGGIKPPPGGGGAKAPPSPRIEMSARDQRVEAGHA
ncbi:hypothetical protein EJB05_24527, partial [Eragrostis curvula]